MILSDAARMRAALRYKLVRDGLFGRGKPPGKYFLRCLDLYDGAEFAEYATRLARNAFGASAPRFSYRAEANVFCCEDGLTQCFAHKQRLDNYLRGLARRAESMGRFYHLDLIDFADGDRVVEVGANVGDLSLAIAQRGVRINYLGFEPSPREFAALEINVAAHHQPGESRVERLALWKDDSAALTFYVKSGTADSSILPIEESDETITVAAARLDTVLERRPYKLLKLEAEGAEPEILEGAEGCLDCFEYISADVGFERGVRQESTLPAVTHFLLERGWEMVAVGEARLVVLYRNPARMGGSS